MCARNEMISCALLIILGAQHIEGSDLNVKCATGVITGNIGSSVVLPCWLSPPMDVQGMEIRWYRPNLYSTPVLLYLNRLIVTEQLEGIYRNRTSLSRRNEDSTGLKEGDVSLKLGNLTMADRGTFHCFVSGDQSYGSGTLTLNLTALGTSPILSLQLQGNLVNITCRSCGWLPKPQVEWKADKQTLRPGGVVFSQEREELICVHSWVLLSPAHLKLVSCFISLSEGEKRVGHMDIQDIVPLEHEEGPWKALFTVSVLAALALVAISVYFYRKYKAGYTAVKKDEETGESACPKTTMEALRKEAVNITLDDTGVSPDLKIAKGKAVRDTETAASSHEGPGFPYHLSICGINRFSSGRAYWEVKLKAPNTATKSSWLIGVTNSENMSKFTPSSGFWFLYLSKETGLRVNTEPEISLPLVSRPECVGVLLDYDQGELSFYNVKEGICLITMKAQFKGEVKPLFNPGIGDHAPLRIHNITTPSALWSCRGC